MTWYNDNDPFVAAWLRNLIAAGQLPEGRVDEQTIKCVSPMELPERCHFFAGIGGWPLALRLAGWPSGRPVWTGSCPCQPFSAAGKRQADQDKRDLWPAWFSLICACKPPIILGEQVPGAIGLGWLDRVCDDLEAEDYTCGAVVLPACSVGPPHIRSRLFWVAIANGAGSPPKQVIRESKPPEANLPGASGENGGMADSERAGLEGRPKQSAREECATAERDGSIERLGEPDSSRLQQRSAASETLGYWRTALSAGWDDSVWITCADGKQRRIPHAESGIRPLAYGLPSRVGQLKAYGNSIVPQVAAVFVRAVMEM